MVYTAENAEAAYFWNKIGFLWPFFIVLLFQFTLAFTENRFAAGKRKYILYLPALVFSLLELMTNQISGNPVLGPWGYRVTGSETFVGFASSLWSAGTSIASILLCVYYYFRVKDETKKHQVRIVTLGLAYPIVLTILSEGANMLLGWVIPHTGFGSNAILCLLVAYAIWKHGLFNINPAIAAENIIATMPDSFVLTNSNGEILRANPALTSLLGYEEKVLAGKTVQTFLTNGQSKTIFQDLNKKREVKNREAKLKTKQGVQKPVAISASAINDKAGKTMGIVLIIHDLTRQKQIEEEIVKAQHFATIGELAGMVGHDLRNPLASIQGATYYLKRKYADGMGGSGKEMLDTIENSIQYADKIVNDLVDYSREIRLEPEETNPKSLMAHALSLVPSAQNVQLVDLTAYAPLLRVDTAKMCRVFVNIIKNAFEAMPNGGTLTLRSAESDADVEISVQDTGVGMSQEAICQLWKPLFTTKARGIGLGLAICKRMVEAHDGSIRVQSAMGEGTTFTVSLPLKCVQSPKILEAVGNPLTENYASKVNFA